MHKRITINDLVILYYNINSYCPEYFLLWKTQFSDEDIYVLKKNIIKITIKLKSLIKHENSHKLDCFCRQYKNYFFFKKCIPKLKAFNLNESFLELNNMSCKIPIDLWFNLTNQEKIDQVNILEFFALQKMKLVLNNFLKIIIPPQDSLINVDYYLDQILSFYCYNWTSANIYSNSKYLWPKETKTVSNVDKICRNYNGLKLNVCFFKKDLYVYNKNGISLTNKIILNALNNLMQFNKLKILTFSVILQPKIDNKLVHLNYLFAKIPHEFEFIIFDVFNIDGENLLKYKYNKRLNLINTLFENQINVRTIDFFENNANNIRLLNMEYKNALLYNQNYFNGYMLLNSNQRILSKIQIINFTDKLYYNDEKSTISFIVEQEEFFYVLGIVFKNFVYFCEYDQNLNLVPKLKLSINSLEQVNKLYKIGLSKQIFYGGYYKITLKNNKIHSVVPDYNRSLFDSISSSFYNIKART